MERTATDILGELPITDKKSRYILVVLHYYSKWTESFPMKNIEAETVANIIVEQVLTRSGVPYAIHSDQGTQFESRLFGEVCKLFGIKKTRTMPYHSKSDGTLECFNKTLATMLSAYLDEHQNTCRML
jgi:transposase InsO family protein